MNKLLRTATRVTTLATSLATVLGTIVATTAQAADIDSLDNLAQDQFHALTEDLGAALSYKALSPAKALGITGFDLSLAVTGTQLDHVEVLKQASSDSSVPSTLPLATVRLAKGLPFNIDIGAFYLAVPGSNIKLYGGEARWAFVEGGLVMPAISIHGAYSKVTGVDQLDLSSKTVDVSISKGFTVITPYAGIGQVWTDAKPMGDAATAGLAKESITQTKLFAGLNFNFGLPNIAVEADKTGGITSYGMKFGLRW
jgi:hypothetical protein